ncbi:MAG TPA: asparagine synthase (glutamine-hydrolyzing) [Flavisolibacter sp.]
MCGIAGIVSIVPSHADERVRSSLGCLAHRGPEGEGLWTNEAGTVALGHRRLAIIDLSEAAAQPMHYLGRYSVVFNGEIYNYQELRDMLRMEGFQFKTDSDTEVLLAAYAAWGPACLRHFDGMFAFALWDAETGVLFAARDRLGEKPFFFSYDEQQLVFASEVKALVQMGISRDVNEKLLYNFLTIGYTVNPGDPGETFYREIRKLPAATSMTFDLGKGEMVLEKYWQPYVDVQQNLSAENAVEMFREMLRASVQRRMRSDVPLGTSLSGGIDSSSVVALIGQQTNGTYTHNCFTGVFPGFGKDEKMWSEKVAGTFGLHQYTTTIDASEVASLMNEVMAHHDAPFGSASPLLQYRVYQLARQHDVTVLQDGQGADELLAGYHKYYRWYWQELYRKGVLKESGELSAARANGIREPFGLLHRGAAMLPDFTASVLHVIRQRQAAAGSDLHRDFVDRNRSSFYYTTPASFDLNGVLYYDTFVNGLEGLLTLADRNSMAHSVEVRLPFLDHRLVEFLFALPPSFKIRGGWTKWLLRESVKDMLPQEIVWRKDKVGFEPPQRLWMEDPAVQQAIRHAKEEMYRRGIIRRSAVDKKIQPHDAYVAENMDWRIWTASYLWR